MLPRDNENPFNFARRRFCCMSCAGKWSMAQKAINHPPAKRAASVKSPPLESKPCACGDPAVEDGRCAWCHRLWVKSHNWATGEEHTQPAHKMYDGNDAIKVSL